MTYYSYPTTSASTAMPSDSDTVTSATLTWGYDNGTTDTYIYTGIDSESDGAWDGMIVTYTYHPPLEIEGTWSWYSNYYNPSLDNPPLETEEERQEQKAAVKRAEELLKEYIGEKAFGKLHEVGYIELDSQKYKGRKYRVPANHMAYIEVLDEKGKVIDTLCVHPAIECPPADHIITRVAMLQNDEETLLAAANHWGARDGSYYN